MHPRKKERKGGGIKKYRKKRRRVLGYLSFPTVFFPTTGGITTYTIV
jgi:hypothetical protein